MTRRGPAGEAMSREGKGTTVVGGDQLDADYGAIL